MNLLPELERARAFIDEHLEQPLSLDDEVTVYPMLGLISATDLGREGMGAVRSGRAFCKR